MGAQTSAGSSDDQLQQQIQAALKNEPTLANDNINVSVTASSIELSGAAATGKEKQTAKRIVDSYAGNRKVVNHITVGGVSSGMGSKSTPSSNPPSAGENQKPPQQ
jgi:osmotically-inducible protein OsmY